MTMLYEVGTAEAPRLNRRQKAKARTRTKVLDVARDLFMERGYERTTIRDIAKGTSMSTGAVFANFKNKAEVFMAVANDEFEVRMERLRDVRGRGMNAMTQLNAISVIDYELYLDRLPLAGMLSSLAWQSHPDIAAYLRAADLDMVSLVAEVIEQGKREQQFASWLDAMAAAEIVWAIHESGYQTAVFDPEAGDKLDRGFSRKLAIVITSFKN